MPTSNPKLEVYKASAGSGKTFQLALKYISLLLGERREDGSIRLYTHAERKMHREILAITFTNKATNEMKQRIITELTLLANPALKSDYRPILIKATGATAVTLAQAAREALTSMLYDYGKIQVSTIDAFFQRILRSFAYEADLSGNYELSLDDKEVINNAIADTLTQVCGFKSKSALDRKRVARIRNWVEQIIHNRYNNAEDVRVFDKDNAVRTSLVKFINDLNNESYKTRSEEIDEFFDDPEAIDKLIAALNAKLKQITADIHTAATNILALEGARRMGKSYSKWVEDTLGAQMPEPTPSFKAYISGKNNIAATIKKEQDTPALIAELNNWIGHLRLYWTVKVMLAQMYNLGLFHEVLDVAAHMKVRLNTILLSDTNTMLNEIIANSDTPFIYERIGERLRHFLIDEFQDTSMLQWLNLHPLVANSLGSGYDNMIIGDVKQCIYRFRNSYPDLLDTELESDGRLSYAISLPRIDTNWRSSREVVEFNNALFSKIGVRHGVHSYGGVTQNYSPKAKAGYVDVASTANFNEDYVRRMVSHMSRQLASGYRASDIVVLVRKHSIGARVVSALLDHTGPGGALEGLSIVSNESLYLRHANSVRYIIAQLRELDRIWNPTEKEGSPKHTPRATDRELDWIQESLRKAQAEGKTGADAIELVMQEFDRLGNAVGLTPTEEAAWRERMRGRALFEIVEELVTMLPEPAWKETEPQYITALQDLIADYSHRSAPSIHGFLKLWDEKHEQTAAVGLAEGANAIRVMTVHSSKGLEFDCVHVVMENNALNEEKDYRWYDAEEIFSRLNLGCAVPKFFPLKSSADVGITLFAPEYERLRRAQFVDELNSLYVALTRAKRELIATFHPGGKDTLDAATVVNHGLPDSAGCAEAKEWAYTYGEPTQKDSDEEGKKEPVDTIRIKQYEVFDRLDTWHSTRVADDQDQPLS